jgi:hypothetical protein
MRIFNYKFNTEVHPDIAFLIKESLESEFTETKLSLQVHAYSEYSFFFIAEKEDQDKMTSIIMKIVDDVKTDDVDDIYYGVIVDDIKDVTDEVFKNIDKYADLVNLYNSLSNVVLNFYYNSSNADTVLDKIIENGISSLGKHDKIILEESVKYK